MKMTGEKYIRTPENKPKSQNTALCKSIFLTEDAL